MEFALKMMNPALKMTKWHRYASSAHAIAGNVYGKMSTREGGLTLKMMDFAFKMMDFAFKMMDFYSNWWILYSKWWHLCLQWWMLWFEGVLTTDSDPLITSMYITLGWRQHVYARRGAHEWWRADVPIRSVFNGRILVSYQESWFPILKNPDFRWKNPDFIT